MIEGDPISSNGQLKLTKVTNEIHFRSCWRNLKVKNRVRSLAADIHLMYEWGKGWHIPATWVLDGKEICYYDSQLFGNNSSPPFAYYIQ